VSACSGGRQVGLRRLIYRPAGWWSMRGGAIFCNAFKVIWVIQSAAQKYFAFAVGQISSTSSPRPFPARGRIARRHERGRGCGGRGSVGAQGDRRADR